MRITNLATFFMAFSLLACTSEPQHPVEKIADRYYETYNRRENIDDLLAFYSDSLVLEDMITGDVIRGKEELRQFFDWPNEQFKLVTSNTLIVTDRVIGEDQVAYSGYFEPFMWGELRFESMHFTMLLTFDEAGKIIHDKDWINYPNNLLNYEQRKNSNARLPSNQVGKP